MLLIKNEANDFFFLTEIKAVFVSLTVVAHLAN